MKNTLPQFVLGYHGCDVELVRQLLEARTQLKWSRNRYDWLGSGIYFWENAPYRAMEWAVDCSKNPRLTKGSIQNPAVIGAVIDLGNCLNLTDTHHQNVIRAAYKELQKICKEQSLKMPENKGNSRNLDCTVINAAIELNKRLGYPAFDSVRCPYFEGKELYPNASFQDRTHIQLCILNPDCIKGYFLPAEFLQK